MADLLVPVLLVEGVLLVAIVTTTVLHAAWTAGRRRRLAGRLAAAQTATVAAVGLQPTGSSTGDALHALGRLPRRERLLVLARIGSVVTGQGRDRIAFLTRASGIARRLQRGAGSRRARRRLRAVRGLTATGTGDRLVPALLDDRDPEVRAQATTWVVRHGDDAAVARLVHRLFDGNGLTRFAAADAAVRIGPRAVEPLARALATADAGPRVVMALRVAGHVGDVRALEAVRRHVAAGDPLVRATALTAVARLGGLPEAALLAAALDDPDPDVRTAAAAGLGRVGAWRHAGALGRALRDPAWSVRRAAGLALVALEAPGLLVLRGHLQDEDRFAADMAGRVLDERRIA